MKLKELTGYKDSGYYPAAQQVFKNPTATDNPNRSEFNREFQLQKWTQFLEAKGFVHLGSGLFGSTYEKPGYPWVFKIFKNDFAYRYYFKYAKAHQSNPNVPQVKGDVIKINDETFAVRIEKLQPIDNTLHSQLYAAIRAMTQAEGLPEKSIPKDIGAVVNQFKKEYPGMHSVVTDMLKLPWKLDMGRGNIMMRGDVPVIVDPIAAI